MTLGPVLSPFASDNTSCPWTAGLWTEPMRTLGKRSALGTWADTWSVSPVDVSKVINSQNLGFPARRKTKASQRAPPPPPALAVNIPKASRKFTSREYVLVGLCGAQGAPWLT